MTAPLANLLKACQFSDVQLGESFDSIKASCMGLCEVLNDLKLLSVFQIQRDLTDAGPGVGFQMFLQVFEMLNMQGCMALFIG